jgi:hypothetical protein
VLLAVFATVLAVEEDAMIRCDKREVGKLHGINETRSHVDEGKLFYGFMTLWINRGGGFLVGFPSGTGPPCTWTVVCNDPPRMYCNCSVATAPERVGIACRGDAQ